MEGIPRYRCYQYACGFKISLISDYGVDERPTLVLWVICLVGADVNKGCMYLYGKTGFIILWYDNTKLYHADTWVRISLCM